MESLAQRLCEAVDNEDTQEVEALLKRGANPNLVLPNGVAAIHLASGKENESALRCLGLILQHGGDANVRSIEELTPVHVAASWGCCKALVALLRRGGDPTLQDQDGNTASDLALIEQNRRSVVTLQEYMERNADGAWADRNYGDSKNKTYDDITQISRISLLLEAPCDNSMLSSTRISPLALSSKNDNVGKRMDNAVILSQVDLLSLDADYELKYKEPDKLSKRGSFTSCKILPYMKPNKLSPDHIDCKMEHFEQLPSTQASRAHCCVADSSRCLKGDVHYLKAVDLHLVQEQQFTVPINGHKVIDHFCFAKNDFSKRAQVDGGDIVVINSNVCIDPKINSWKTSGLDVTSPDHVFIYTRGTTKDGELEETLIMTDQDIHEDLGDQHESCSSNYNSCQSDCSPNTKESSNVNGQSNLKSQGIQLSQVNDGCQTHNAICKGGKSSLEEKSSRTVNLQVSSQEFTPSLPEKYTLNLGNRYTEMCTPQLNHHIEGNTPKTDVMSHENQIQLTQPLTRETEVLCIDQSSTLISVRSNVDLSPTQGILSNESQTQLVGQSQNIAEETCTSRSSIMKTGRGDDDYYRNDQQDLRSRLRHMMLLTKACASKLLQDTQPVQDDISQGSTADTIPVKQEEMSAEEQSQVINENLKATMLLSKRQQSSTESATPDTLAVETDALIVQENWDTELRAKLRNLMLSTKEFPVLSMGDEGKEKPHCFFTPRTKSRLNSSSRHSNSSLFDETVEMPQRGMRVRSPDSTLHSPLPNTSRIVSSEKTSGTCELKGLKVQSVVSVNQGEKNQSTLLKPEEIVNVSDFLTDDLSTESETTLSGSHLKVKARVPMVDFSGNTWLTEDGEEESSGESHKEYPINGSLQCGYQFPGSCFNDSLVHSTLLEDPVVKSMSSANPRYSFSRLSSIVRSKEELTNPCQQNQIGYSDAEAVPLSPGGRPVNVSRNEPLEYLYLDSDKGHSLIERHVPCMDKTSRDSAMEKLDDTILYDWREYKTSTQAVCPTPPNRVAVELYRLSNVELARRLMEVGEDNCGPVTSQNRKSYIKLLDKRLKEQLGKRNKGFTGITGHSPELSLALHTFDILDCNSDEAVLSLEFDQPDKTRKWREGILKCSFNYLLMDPRVSRNLPSRCHNVSESDCFRTFVSSIFYVGKGKRSRPYSHLYEALTLYKDSNKQLCSKVQHILDIWKSGLGVISLHCFQSTIPVEAYTREACMVDAIGLKMLTNQKKGAYYGQMHNWNPARQRRLGVHMLYKAMQIFLAEGERQLRPPDIHSK